MKKILFIEDEIKLNEAYKRKFSISYQIDFAIDSVSGLKKIEDWKPDLIVLDIIIPGELNGIDILRKLKSNEKTSSVPVLVLTNLEDQEKTVLDLGAVGCLTKSNTSFNEVADKIAIILK